MKATKIISACAVLVALASCSNEHELSQQSAEDTPIRIQANVGGITTRAGSDIQGSQFQAGETIGIFLKEHLGASETNVMTYSNDITGTVNSTDQSKIDLSPAQYFPSNGRSVDCLAIYPKQFNSANIDDNTHSFSVEEDQSADAKYKASDLMYAYKENTARKTPIQLTFTHLLSKIIVEVVADASVNKDVLSDVYVDLLNTNKTIDITVDDIGQGNPSSAKSVSVVPNPSGSTTINLGHPTYSSGDTNTGEVAAIIVPQTINSSTDFIKVRLNKAGSDYATYTYTPTADQTFDGTKSYKYTITIKAGSISVSNVTIAPWVDESSSLLGGSGNGDATLD